METDLMRPLLSVGAYSGPAPLQTDKEVVLAAVKQNKEALKSAHTSLHNDQDIIQLAGL